MKYLVWSLVLVGACKGEQKEPPSPDPIKEAPPAKQDEPPPPEPAKPAADADTGKGACQWVSRSDMLLVVKKAIKFTTEVAEDVNIPCSFRTEDKSRDVVFDLTNDESELVGDAVEGVGEKAVIDANGNLLWKQNGKIHRVRVDDATVVPTLPMKPESLAAAQAIAKRIEANPPK